MRLTPEELAEARAAYELLLDLNPWLPLENEPGGSDG